MQNHLGVALLFFHKNISPGTQERGGDSNSLFPSCVRCGNRNSEAWGSSASPSTPPGPPPLTLEHRQLSHSTLGMQVQAPEAILTNGDKSGAGEQGCAPTEADRQGQPQGGASSHVLSSLSQARSTWKQPAGTRHPTRGPKGRDTHGVSIRDQDINQQSPCPHLWVNSPL